jgi:Ca2+-transporting ATPase
MTTGNVPSKFLLPEIYSRLFSHKDGLTEKEAMQKQMTFGKNVLPEKKKDWMKMLLSEFTSPLVLILLAAVLISLVVPLVQNGHIAWHDFIEPGAILVILIFNALLGFFQELKAENTLQSLKTLQPEESTVMRAGQMKKVLAEDLVVGDILFLSEGEKIPADIRLLEAVECKVDESLLTGESLPVEKSVHGSGDGALSDIKNMIFSGSQLISGRVKGIVTGIGVDTEIGKIAHLLSEIQSPPTPLEHKLDILGKRIGIAVIAICVLIFTLSFFKGVSVIDALLTAVALAVGAVPEGLPAVMTISLAIGVSIMAKKNMLTRELKSVETLGSITTIASDKTGTITQNKMSVEEIFIHNPEKNGKFYSRHEDEESFDELKNDLFFAVLQNCNDAQLPNIGDPTEVGLLKMAQEKNAPTYERISEVPFSSEKKWMSTTHNIEYILKDGSKQKITVDFLKGAPEVIAEFCNPSEQEMILESSDTMAKKGIRTIGVAIRHATTKEEQQQGKQKRAVFLGIAGLQDPPREGVKKAIYDAKSAGIRTLMITGDHAVTASAIGEKVGIYGDVMRGVEIEKTSDEQLQEIVKEVSIYARVSPEHKVRICKALQANGEIVAMTGDGVNDAPAISQAEVGIAMGKVGTSVARNASDMVLLDDDFSSIVRGIKEGRRIFANIKKSVVFLLSTNFSEVLLLLAALIVGLPLPLLPLHILLINLFTDSFPALALSKESAEADVMRQKPRPINEGFLHGTLLKIIGVGTMIATLTLAFFAYSMLEGDSLLSSQTLAFVTLSLAELFIIFSLRSDKSLFSKDYFHNINWWIVYACIGGVVVTLAMTFTPLQHLLSFEGFSLLYFVAIFIGIGITVLISEEIKHFQGPKSKKIEEEIPQAFEEFLARKKDIHDKVQKIMAEKFQQHQKNNRASFLQNTMHMVQDIFSDISQKKWGKSA